MPAAQRISASASGTAARSFPRISSTLAPSASLDTPAHGVRAGIEFDAKPLFQRLCRGHLVGHRADAADARHHVGNFRVMAALQKLLAKTREVEREETR